MGATFLIPIMCTGMSAPSESTASTTMLAKKCLCPETSFDLDGRTGARARAAGEQREQRDEKSAEPPYGLAGGCPAKARWEEGGGERAARGHGKGALRRGASAHESEVAACRSSMWRSELSEATGSASASILATAITHA